MNPQQQDPFGQQYGVNIGQPPMPMQQMQPAPPAKHRSGLVGVTVALILSVVLLLGSIGFGVWAYMGMQDYKNHADDKISAAVKVAQAQTASDKDKQFIEKEKSPLKEYKGPAAFGTVSVKYPKTWGAFVTEATDDNSNTPVDGYFHPNFVPGLQSGTDFALRVQIVNRSYADELKQFDGKIKQGKVKSSPYIAPKVPGVTGSMVEGEITTGQHDTMVLLPIRDKTIEISTQSVQFRGDFDTIVMANLTFVP